MNKKNSKEMGANKIILNLHYILFDVKTFYSISLLIILLLIYHFIIKAGSFDTKQSAV